MGRISPGFPQTPGFRIRPPAHPVPPPIVGPLHRSFGPRPRLFGPQPFFGFSPFFWSAPIYSSPLYAEPTYVTPPVSQNEVELANQVERLSQQIEQLREEQALGAVRQAPPPPPPSQPERPAVPTVLVFRDGHRMMVQNWAIVAETFWALDENAATKISLSDLDLAATQKENLSRGIRFPLPER
jgi:hypothetical protein